jgi:hypothetical protein
VGGQPGRGRDLGRFDVGRRPRSSVVFFAKLLAEKFAGTIIAQHFAESER